MRAFVGFLAAFLALGAGAPPPDPAADPPPLLLRWLSADGAVSWTTSLRAEPAGSGSPPRPLLAGNEVGLQLPDRTLDTLPEGSVALRNRDGRALILNFWASWCEPCAVELPRLQRLYEIHRESGLDVVAVNVEDSAAEAASFAKRLGLTLPLGRYDSGLDQALQVRSLPTVILADGKGRIRARWNGYRTDLVDTIDALVRELLDGRPVENRELATVTLGGDSLAVLWDLEWSAPIEGLATGAGPDGAELRFVAGRNVVRVEPGGMILGRHPAPPGAGLLRAADLDGDGLDEWITFRRGGSRVFALAPGGEALQSWELASPVLDLLPIAAASPGESGSILLGTIEGMKRAALDGSLASSSEGVRGVRALAATARSQAALELAGRLCWIDSSLEAQCVVPAAPALGLVSAGPGAAGLGLLSSEVGDVVPGHFLAEDRIDLALAFDGQLLLLDADTGRPVYRALWPEVSRLAAQPTGSGRDRLVVGSGRRVAMLGPPVPPAMTSADGP